MLLSAVGCCFTRTITIEDSCIDHAVAFYLQYEALFIGHKFCRDGEVAIYILSQNRAVRRYGTWQGNTDHSLHGTRLKLSSMISMALGFVASRRMYPFFSRLPDGHEQMM